MKKLRTAQIAKMLGVTKDTILNWSRSGEFPAPIRIGNCMLFEEAEVMNFLHTRLVITAKELNNDTTT